MTTVYTLIKTASSFLLDESNTHVIVFDRITLFFHARKSIGSHFPHPRRQSMHGVWPCKWFQPSTLHLHVVIMCRALTWNTGHRAIFRPTPHQGPCVCACVCVCHRQCTLGRGATRPPLWCTDHTVDTCPRGPEVDLTTSDSRCLARRSSRSARIMLYNYQFDVEPSPLCIITVRFVVKVAHFRLSKSGSYSLTAAPCGMK